MEVIKRLFGVLMLAVAIWFLERVFAGPFTLALWALLLIVSAIYMGALDRLPPEAGWRRLWKGTGLAMLVYGAVLVVGAASGGHDPLRPLQGGDLIATGQIEQQSGDSLAFAKVESADELREALLQASLQGRPVMFYFTADWCVVCKELERYTYRDAGVVRALRDFVLIKADVTDNNAADRELLRRYELFGPPAILFFDAQASELRNLRLVGFIEAEDFVEHIKRIARS
jgi:thioredoxin:protein disulfide reductase